MQINFVFTSLIVIVGFIFNILSSSIISNSIGNQTSFGDFSSFTQMEFILGMSLSCGIDLAVDKYFPKYIYKNKINAINTFNQFYFSIISVLFIIFLFILSGIYLYHYIHGISFIEDTKLFIDNIYLLITSFIIAINCYFCKILRISGHIVVSTANYLLIPFMIFFLFAFFFQSKDVTIFAKFYSLSWLISFLLTLVLIKTLVNYDLTINLHKLTHQLSIKQKNIKRVFRKNILKDSLFMLLSSTSDNSYGFALIAINIVIAESHDVGLAAAIGGLCMTYLVVIKAISSIYKPSLKLKLLKDKYEAIRFIKKYTRIGILFSVLITATYVVFGEKLLLILYGQEYVRAYVPLLIVSIAFCLVEGFTIHKITLELLESKDIAKAVIITNVISLLLVIIFGSFYGLIGAVIGFLMGRIYYVLLVNNRFNILMRRILLS